MKAVTKQLSLKPILDAAPVVNLKLPTEYANGDYWVDGTTIAIDSWRKCWGITPELKTVYLCTRQELERIWADRRIPEDVKVSLAARDILTREVIEKKMEERHDGDYTPTKAKQAVRPGHSRSGLVRTAKRESRNTGRITARKRLSLRTPFHARQGPPGVILTPKDIFNQERDFHPFLLFGFRFICWFVFCLKYHKKNSL